MESATATLLAVWLYIRFSQIPRNPVLERPKSHLDCSSGLVKPSSFRDKVFFKVIKVALGQFRSMSMGLAKANYL